MSLRGTKRASGSRGDEAGVSKRRRTEPEDALWQLRPVSDLKMSSIYNRSASEAPAELFRKDLISAMKLPDNEPLTPSSYWIITDTWKQDWERGVQVPVNPDSLPAPKVKIIDNPPPPNFQEFKLPKDKYIHLSRDAHYHSDKHILSQTPARAEAACCYDLDATDTAWLKLLNAERARAGAPPVTEDQLEKVIEELEVRSWDKIQAIVKSEEGLGIEYDENVICDVCRSPDSEDGNEMVFCDSCNICVHQACYGITVIPDGQWLCRPCGDGVRPSCVLCPNHGGAMKCTPSGHKWAHVSCVLWIPEVSIGCAEVMEPITKISSIPASRWSLVCILCRNRKGACIQCSVKTCKTAYHVTCAFKHGLEMRAIIEDENADDGVKLRSYCQKHSVNSKKEKCTGSGEEEDEVKRKRRKDMTSEEKTQARAARLHEIEREFDKHVSVKDISTHLLDVDQDAINYMYHYWKLKRRAGHNRPLLPPKSDDTEVLTHRQEQADLDKLKMFVQLRQDLERVRNLCYMVSRREKLSRSFFRMREQTFHKQVAVLSAAGDIPPRELSAIIEANHGPSIYDKLYSHDNAPDHKNDFEDLLARIAPTESGDEKKKDRNGLVKGKSTNPYKKHYVNGSRRSGSMYSGLSSEESAPEVEPRPSRFRGKAIGSSTDDERKKPSTSPKKKVSPKATKGKRSPKKTERKKKKVPQSKALIESSSDDESLNSRLKKDQSCSKTLQQMEKEMTAGRMGQSGTDSDDLMPIRPTMRNSKFPIDIYSDSSEDNKTEVKPDKTKVDKTKTEKEKADKAKVVKSPCGNDSQQSLPRTKAAMKEFISTQPEKKTTTSPDVEKPAPRKRGRKPSNKGKKVTPNKTESDDEAKNKENIKHSKQKDHPTDLIVPQRQAAKKASENMRSTTVVKKDESVTQEPQREQKPTSSDETKSKPSVKAAAKTKGKEMKDAHTSKVGRKKAKEVEKEPISYVPQRQAAKKAAAHIKSGLGTKFPAVENDADKKKDADKVETKLSPKKEKDDAKSSKSAQKASSSSSSNSSSSSYSSSSSSEEEPEKPSIKPTAKAREIKPVITTRQPSMFSPPGSRPTVDLPFLDRVSRPLSSTSASSDSDSSKVSDGSRSGSPYPKRPRRRRKGKSVSADVSSLKAPPDKKLKTSELRSECRVPSPTPEGEEPSRPSDARAATRARTRSTTSGGNMPNKSDARPGKPSKDEANTVGTNKTPKEGGQSSELPTAERKADEEVKIELKEEIKQDKKEEPVIETPKNYAKGKANKPKRRSESNDDKEKTNKMIEIEVPPVNKISPRKSVEPKQKSLMTRRMSVKESAAKDRSTANEAREPTKKDRRLSVAHNVVGPEKTAVSPVKKKTTPAKVEIEIQPEAVIGQKSPIRINTDYHDNDKHWLPKAPSPNTIPPQVEKPGTNEKYIDDKSMDSDCADKSSVKMIAKIQATLNENTMIKSPKTPMDARTVSMEHMEDETVAKNIRKGSTEKKFITQDASHVQGVEISKSAKIPSTVNSCPNRSMFSPQSKDNEFLDFEMMAVDDGFNHDDIIKPFATYPEFFFKEEVSKEQGVQETLNLVDRLRIRLSTKKVPPENPDQEEPIVVIDDNDSKDNISSVRNLVKANEEKNQTPNDRLAERSPPKETRQAVNHVPRITTSIERDLPSGDTAMDAKEFQPVPMTSNEKWSNVPVSVSQMDTQSQSANDRKYDNTSNSYVDDVKEPITLQSDVRSVSEVGDNISISKQSDDSQSLSVVDHSVHSNDVELVHDTMNQNYDNNEMIHSDCATISSPQYVSQEKWRESKITTRRSSASSTNSEASMSSHKNTLKSRLNTSDLRPGNVMPVIDTYPPIPAYSRPVEPSMPLNQYTTYPPEASPFLSSLPLFAGAASLPLPSPGPLYAPIPYTAATPLPLKPAFYSAAFTSSSQNIALTTAMIAPPTPKPLDSPRDDIDVTGSSDKFSIHVVSSPSVSVDSFDTNSNRAPTKMSNDSNETMTSLHPQESKSPPKLSKASTKFPGKSPGKSPGISPKQSDAPKGTKRPSNRSNRSQRGRGRSKSRGQGFAVDYMGNSIQSKLVGTVYDFDEEIANDGVDLKALRDKRKSIDVRDDRKSEHSYKDSSQSPRVLTPPPNKRRAISESKEIKPPTTPEPADMKSSPSCSDREQGFSQVAPVLPGPVDMRTYQPFENPAPAADNAYHLMAFVSGTAEQQLTEIDEEVEKQLHTALMASNPQTESPSHQPTEPSEPPKETITPQLPKVSLSDSRNQLKVKIKGPFLDANYSASTSQPVVPPPPAPVYDPSPSTMNTTNAPSMMSGSTNLRRMRKKELLRQYWTQDMNMDDPTHNATIGAVPPPVAPLPLTRAVITIPKAVASMTSIPTREDYKISDSPIEKKTKRKTTSGLSRELRHLEVSMNDDVDPSDDVKLSSIAGTSSLQAHKRRGRTSAKPNRANATSPVAPKLKIKLGANTVQQVPAPAPAPTEEPAGSTIYRPPKKRIIAFKPSLEDLRRESMKYRRMVMANFEEDEPTKPAKTKPKSEKSEKRKKKKDKKAEKLQVVNRESDSATKLIIKIKRTKDDEAGKQAGASTSAGAGSSAGAVAVASAAKAASAGKGASAGKSASAAKGASAGAAPPAATTVAEPAIDPFEYDPSAPDPLAIDPPSYSETTSALRKMRTEKVTPIRLKLARSSEGSGYVMKESGEGGDARPSVPVNNNKHCEVR